MSSSGRVKLNVVKFILHRQYSSSRVNFLLCHRYFKATRVAIGALFASWCLIEYMFIIEILDINLGICNQGFRLNVSPFVFNSFINQSLRVAAP